MKVGVKKLDCMGYPVVKTAWLYRQMDRHATYAYVTL